MIVSRAGSKAARGDYSAMDWVESSAGIIQSMEYCGSNFEISGLRHLINLNGPCVIVGNHMSTLETFALPCMVQPHKDLTFVVKDSLLRYPWFGHVLKSRDPIVVNRASLRADLEAMLKGGAERLEQGRSIVVFPQGSRAQQVDPKHFNSIGVKIARRSKVPVIPLALRTDSWGTGKKIKDFGAIRPHLGVRFKFGPPLGADGEVKNVQAEVLHFILDNLRVWGLQQPALTDSAD